MFITKSTWCDSRQRKCRNSCPRAAGITGAGFVCAGYDLFGLHLDQQDTAQWSVSLIAEAESHLRTASALQRIGRYQLEAAIQSIHADRAVSGTISWNEILLFYEGLLRIAPGIGSQVGRAVAMAQAGEPVAGSRRSKKSLPAVLSPISRIGRLVATCCSY